VPRKGHVPKREILPDPVYKDKVVAKLINNIMLDGKKGVAQRICYDAFDIIKTKTGKDPLEVFKQALENIMPALEVKARRVGGATYQVPVEVRPERRQALALRWLVQFARNRNEHTMKQRLAAEIMDSVNGVSNTFKRKEEMHRMAEANKAFAHYRW
jgi:small subunit ribosomal protein S7